MKRLHWIGHKGKILTPRVCKRVIRQSWSHRKSGDISRDSGTGEQDRNKAIVTDIHGVGLSLSEKTEIQAPYLESEENKH